MRGMRLAVLLLATLLAVSARAGETSHPAARALKERGDALRKSGDPAGALEAYRSAIKQHAGFAEAWAAAGELHYQQKAYGEAIEAFGRAVEIDPAFATAWYNLAFAARKSGDLARAKGAYDRYVALRPSDADGRLGLAETLRALGEREAAIREYEAFVLLAQATPAQAPRVEKAKAAAAELRAAGTATSNRTATPTPTSTPTATPTATATATPTPTPTSTSTSTSTATPTATPTPTATSTSTSNTNTTATAKPTAKPTASSAASVPASAAAAPAARPPPPPVARSAVPVVKPAAPAAPPKPTPPPALEPAALRAQLEKLAGADHFQVLGVKKDAQPATVKIAYFQLAKTYHPDAVPVGAPEEAKKLAADLFARISEAWGVLGDEARRAEYTKELESGGAANVDVMSIFAAENAFQQGTLLVKARKYDEARAKFEEALKLNAEEPEFGVWKAWCEFLLAADKKRAHAGAAGAVEAALRKNGRCLPAYLFLGQMAKIVGDLTLAEKHLKRGLAVEPENGDLVRELKYLRK
jgi:tetratricopeptide (TPR) repeat protein